MTKKLRLCIFGKTILMFLPRRYIALFTGCMDAKGQKFALKLDQLPSMCT